MKHLYQIFLIGTDVVILSGSCPQTYDNGNKKITSPNYPAEYSHNSDCNWNVQVPEGSRIELRFDTFSLESHSNCQYDSLQVFDGSSSRSRSLVTTSSSKLCGSNRPQNIVSSGNTIHLIFTSDVSVGSSGFRINVLELVGK